MMRRFVLVLAVIAATGVAAFAQQPQDYAVRVFKRVGGDSLVMHIFTPAKTSLARPAVLLFHGGAFVWGGPETTDGSAREYARLGLVAFSVEYRLVNRGTITPIEQLDDAFDAIRWVRSHAAEFGVDPGRIVAHGVSAGGYLATMATGSSDAAVRPNAVVLWSPGVGWGDPYFRGLFGGRPGGNDLVPMKHLRAPMPPTILISGALDSVTFDSDARSYCTGVRNAKGRCDLHSYPNLGHLLSRRLDARSQQRGQFDWDPVATKDAQAKVTAFLRSLGFLQGAQRQDTTVRSYDGRTMPAQIIRISVPERRLRPGRTITVAALRIPTTAERPGRPIVFLMGGPGIPGSAMALVPPYFTLFQRLRELADVVIVDQRSLGRSEPAIDCPVDKAPPTDLFLRRERIVQTIRDRVASCVSEFQSRGIDPTAYNTIESADDIDDLRKVLGAEQIDLLAFSYGSRLALMYVQRHEGRVGRIVLQGVNGPGLVVKRPGPVARKLDRMAAVLKQDSSWRGSTDLRAAARAARERLARNPAAVTITGRRDGRQLDLVIGRDGFDALVALNLDDVRLPALLVSVAAGDDRVLTRFAEAVWNGLAGGTVGLMARAVNCAADRPESRWDIVRSESATAPFGSPIDNEFLTDEFCRTVGYTVRTVEFVRPLESSAPVLLLTGSLDATNPIENAAEVSRGFANAVSLEVENAPHEALPVSAVQDVVLDWFRGADVRGRRLAASPPSFASVEAAAAAPQRGR